MKSSLTGSVYLQTKETLTLRQSSFGSKCELADKFIKKVGNDCGVIELVASFASFKNSKELKKSDGAKRSRIPGTPSICCLWRDSLAGYGSVMAGKTCKARR